LATGRGLQVAFGPTLGYVNEEAAAVRRSRCARRAQRARDRGGPRLEYPMPAYDVLWFFGLEVVGPRRADARTGGRRGPTRM